MLVDLIVQIVGAPPVGWEFVPYLLAGFSYFLGVFLLMWVLSIPLSFLRGKGGKL
jgi:hypothetical protein